jgi:AhpD family alkylhydroperoxidase
MMGYGKAVLNELRDPARQLRQAIPEVYQGFAGLHEAALVSGALTAKTKELIALAIAVSRECDGCIASHARGAARKGATSEEVAEAIGVAILMNGGPGTVYGPRAFAAFQEFTAQPALPVPPAGTRAHAAH